eukprot:1938846-Rhodomonas_salina.1
MLSKHDFSLWLKTWFEGDGDLAEDGVFSAHNRVTYAFLAELLEAFRDRNSAVEHPPTSLSECIQESYEKMPGKWKEFVTEFRGTLNRSLGKSEGPERQNRKNDCLEMFERRVTRRLESVDRRLLGENWVPLDNGSVFFKNAGLDDSESLLPSEQHDQSSPDTAIVVRLLDASRVTAGLLVVIPDGSEKSAFLDAEEALRKEDEEQQVSSGKVTIRLTGKDQCEGIIRSEEEYPDNLKKYTLSFVKETIASLFREPGEGGYATDLSISRITVCEIFGQTPQDLSKGSQECPEKCREFENGK